MRSPSSHKGENGTVAVIGGSRHQHGAPVFSLLAAQASGVDLLFAFVPPCHEEVTKASMFNVQVHTFGGPNVDVISDADRSRIVEFLATIDVAVIGPGLSRSDAAVAGIMGLLESAPCTVVADASALQRDTLKALAHRRAIVTPHLGELERMGLAREELPKIATGIDCTFLLKAPTDVVVSESGATTEVKGGNPGLTAGGTGDALAGLVAGLVAQGMAHDEACVLGSTAIKRAGDELREERGYHFTANDVIELLPTVLHTLRSS